MKNWFVALFVVLFFSGCGGGGGSGSSVVNDSGTSNTDDPQVPSVATCPAVGQGFGGDVVGNEFLENDSITSLLFGDSIGANASSNTDLVKNLQLNSCASVSGLEFGSAYVVKSSSGFAGAIDYAVEVKNVTDRLICEVSVEFDIWDAEGLQIISTKLYSGFATGRAAAIQDSESGLLSGEQSFSCLRPNEIAYVKDIQRGRDTLLGEVLYDAFEEAVVMNVRSASFAGDEWVELPPLFSVSSYTSPASGGDNNVKIEFELQDPTSEQLVVIEQLIPDQSIESAFIRYTVLDSEGRPLYIGGSTGNLLYINSETSRLSFFGSANSIRYRQHYLLNVEPL